ncbi:major facilitator superfamily MFS_1 [Leptothrix cholodnii SP-6]|uniref:Major facilitator superfamily MFS_1 n=1 Tax=Leptothrix cholodnii (strain ATCC 51168 / LMG 8142 / SP-6) TaxID=395495 RepID=B1Y4G1_LEPCP|nr:lysophospholipid transporter LplT [Leptothrix cholodnii]ACB35862.1 major facilitator superfamily MFS_1 [Leptothrix cholodnii SP-6]
MPPGFHLLIAAQFASALADNALLIVTIAVLQERGLPGWWAPMLKFGFTLSYVLLAPLLGPLADAFPKARLMAWMNGVKVLGVLALLAGVHPIAAFVVVGLGAAAYAPAKYGLITELVGPQRLVAANGWLEVSVVCAALFGTGVGGLLVSAMVLDSALVDVGRQWLQAVAIGDAGALSVSLCALLAIYALAGLLNIGVPDSGARYAACEIHPAALMRDFCRANRTLWRDHDGGLSLAVTTIFWGVGATLQFAVLRWATDVLQLPLNQAAYLQAAVAIGVVVGAAAAGRWVPLAGAKRMLWAGVMLGLLMPAVASSTDLLHAVPLLALAGAVGGLLVVPLNALLQHRGYTLLSAGRSVAVQGFNENASVLGMLAVYAALIALDVSIVPLMWGFGFSIAAAIGALMALERARSRLKPPGDVVPAR